MTGRTDIVDITVVGAALAGSTLAYALAEAGWRVALLEQRSMSVTDQAPPAESEQVLDTRSTALSWSSLQILGSLGLWQPPGLSTHAHAIQQVHVSQAGNFGSVRLSASDENLDMLGATIPNQAYNELVLQRVREHPLIDTHDLIRIERLDHGGGKAVRVAVARGEQQYQVQSGLLIAVDGVNSVVRELSGISLQTTDYEQSAVLLNVETQKTNPGIAYERFTASGPLAMLPLGGRLNSVVYSVDPGVGETLCQLDEPQFLQHLQQQFGYRLGRLCRCGTRHLMPLRLVESSSQVAERVLLMGNAARTLHPVAGQGFNLALRDIAGLLELLGKREDTRQVTQVDAESDPENKQSNERSNDPGSQELLKAFLDLRRRDQQRTVRLTDALARVFRGSNPAFSHLRALGLAGLEYTPPLQRQFSRQAMGLMAQP